MTAHLTTLLYCLRLFAANPIRGIREGMSFVNGAPWNTQDAVAIRG